MAYVNNTTLIEALLQSHVHGGLTVQAYEQFQDIIEQRIFRLVKYNIQGIDDIRVLCIQKIELVWQNFKFYKSNVFAYFVSVIDNVIKRWFLDNNVQMLYIDADIENFSN